MNLEPQRNLPARPGAQPRLRRTTLGLGTAEEAPGSTLTEFALVLPLLFAMLFGIIDFGRALYAYHFVSDAAREATRWASVRGLRCNGLDSCRAGSSDVSNYVVSIAPPGIDTSSSKLTVNANWVPPPNALNICIAEPKSPGCAVQVTVTYQFSFILPFLPSSTYPMSSTAEMVISQ
jgi:Flp pilus assembly protein TadG